MEGRTAAITRGIAMRALYISKRDLVGGFVLFLSVYLFLVPWVWGLRRHRILHDRRMGDYEVQNGPVLQNPVFPGGSGRLRHC